MELRHVFANGNLIKWYRGLMATGIVAMTALMFGGHVRLATIETNLKRIGDLETRVDRHSTSLDVVQREAFTAAGRAEQHADILRRHDDQLERHRRRLDVLDTRLGTVDNQVGRIETRIELLPGLRWRGGDQRDAEERGTAR